MCTDPSDAVGNRLLDKNAELDGAEAVWKEATHDDNMDVDVDVVVEGSVVVVDLGNATGLGGLEGYVTSAADEKDMSGNED